jgi:UDP-N-acetylmuramyl pentapeptide phosphotransferase/UDP-N-acetylglucosamine-1-phosphate transferase
MPCLLLLLVLAFPRLILILMFVTSNYLQRAYTGLLLPLLGFIFMPLTTLTYAWLTNSHRPMDGVNLLILILAVIIDLGGVGGGAWHRSRR